VLKNSAIQIFKILILNLLDSINLAINLRAMSEKYKIWNKEKAYFITLTVEGWIDVFTRKNHKLMIIDSLAYCQKEKGLSIFSFCLMPSHLHLIARADGMYNLSEILRDLKKYTSKAIISQIINQPESRENGCLNTSE
jgi:REP element-mobilizing transposase RayT